MEYMQSVELSHYVSTTWKSFNIFHYRAIYMANITFPRQNAEARRFGGIEMRLRSIQIGVFPHI